MIQKRFVKEKSMPNNFISCIRDNGRYLSYEKLENTLNALYEENQALQRHIKRSTFNKIRVEDVFNCAKYDKFYDNKEAIKSIDWIAKALGVDFE